MTYMDDGLQGETFMNNGNAPFVPKR